MPLEMATSASASKLASNSSKRDYMEEFWDNIDKIKRGVSPELDEVQLMWKKKQEHKHLMEKAFSKLDKIVIDYERMIFDLDLSQSVNSVDFITLDKKKKKDRDGDEDGEEQEELNEAKAAINEASQRLVFELSQMERGDLTRAKELDKIFQHLVNWLGDAPQKRERLQKLEAVFSEDAKKKQQAVSMLKRRIFDMQSELQELQLHAQEDMNKFQMLAERAYAADLQISSAQETANRYKLEGERRDREHSEEIGRLMEKMSQMEVHHELETAALTSELTQSKDRIASLTTERKELLKKAEMYNQLEKAGNQMKIELAKKTEMIGDLEAISDKLRNDLIAANSAKSKAQVEHAQWEEKLRDRIQTKDKEIETLKTKVAEMEQDILNGGTGVSLADNPVAAANLAAANEAANQIISSLRHQLIDSENKVGQLHKQVMDLDRELRDLRPRYDRVMAQVELLGRSRKTPPKNNVNSVGTQTQTIIKMDQGCVTPQHWMNSVFKPQSSLQPQQQSQNPSSSSEQCDKGIQCGDDLGAIGMLPASMLFAGGNQGGGSRKNSPRIGPQFGSSNGSRRPSELIISDSARSLALSSSSAKSSPLGNGDPLSEKEIMWAAEGLRRLTDMVSGSLVGECKVLADAERGILMMERQCKDLLDMNEKILQEREEYESRALAIIDGLLNQLDEVEKFHIEELQRKNEQMALASSINSRLRQWLDAVCVVAGAEALRAIFGPDWNTEYANNMTVDNVPKIQRLYDEQGRVVIRTFADLYAGRDVLGQQQKRRSSWSPVADAIAVLVQQALDKASATRRNGSFFEHVLRTSTFGSKARQRLSSLTAETWKLQLVGAGSASLGNVANPKGIPTTGMKRLQERFFLALKARVFTAWTLGVAEAKLPTNYISRGDQLLEELRNCKSQRVMYADQNLHISTVIKQQKTRFNMLMEKHLADSKQMCHLASADAAKLIAETQMGGMNTHLMVYEVAQMEDRFQTNMKEMESKWEIKERQLQREKLHLERKLEDLRREKEEAIVRESRLREALEAEGEIITEAFIDLEDMQKAVVLLREVISNQQSRIEVEHAALKRMFFEARGESQEMEKREAVIISENEEIQNLLLRFQASASTRRGPIIVQSKPDPQNQQQDQQQQQQEAAVDPKSKKPNLASISIDIPSSTSVNSKNNNATPSSATIDSGGSRSARYPFVGHVQVTPLRRESGEFMWGPNPRDVSGTFSSFIAFSRSVLNGKPSNEECVRCLLSELQEISSRAKLIIEDIAVKDHNFKLVAIQQLQRILEELESPNGDGENPEETVADLLKIRGFGGFMKISSECQTDTSFPPTDFMEGELDPLVVSAYIQLPTQKDKHHITNAERFRRMETEMIVLKQFQHLLSRNLEEARRSLRDTRKERDAARLDVINLMGEVKKNQDYAVKLSEALSVPKMRRRQRIMRTRYDAGGSRSPSRGASGSGGITPPEEGINQEDLSRYLDVSTDGANVVKVEIPINLDISNQNPADALIAELVSNDNFSKHDLSPKYLINHASNNEPNWTDDSLAVSPCSKLAEVRLPVPVLNQLKKLGSKAQTAKMDASEWVQMVAQAIQVWFKGVERQTPTATTIIMMLEMLRATFELLSETVNNQIHLSKENSGLLEQVRNAEEQVDHLQTLLKQLAQESSPQESSRSPSRADAALMFIHAVRNNPSPLPQFAPDLWEAALNRPLQQNALQPTAVKNNSRPPSSSSSSSSDSSSTLSSSPSPSSPRSNYSPRSRSDSPAPPIAIPSPQSISTISTETPREHVIRDALARYKPSIDRVKELQDKIFKLDGIIKQSSDKLEQQAEIIHDQEQQLRTAVEENKTLNDLVKDLKRKMAKLKTRVSIAERTATVANSEKETAIQDYEARMQQCISERDTALQNETESKFKMSSAFGELSIWKNRAHMLESRVKQLMVDLKDAAKAQLREMALALKNSEEVANVAITVARLAQEQLLQLGVTEIPWLKAQTSCFKALEPLSEALKMPKDHLSRVVAETGSVNSHEIIASALIPTKTTEGGGDGTDPFRNSIWERESEPPFIDVNEDGGKPWWKPATSLLSENRKTVVLPQKKEKDSEPSASASLLALKNATKKKQKMIKSEFSDLYAELNPAPPTQGKPSNVRKNSFGSSTVNKNSENNNNNNEVNVAARSPIVVSPQTIEFAALDIAAIIADKKSTATASSSILPSILATYRDRPVEEKKDKKTALNRNSRPPALASSIRPPALQLHSLPTTPMQGWTPTA